MKTVCSQAKVLSVIADSKESNSRQDVLVDRLSSMNKAVSVFVRQLQSNFQEYSDVAEPFLAAVMQVRLMVFPNVCCALTIFCRYLKA